MELSRAVMDDLLVLYLGGEASAETRALVESYARQNADYAALVSGANAPLLIDKMDGPAGDQEMKGLEMTKQLIFQSKLAMGLGIFFAMAPFSIYVKGDHVRFLLLRDLPLAAYGCWAISVVSWIVYVRMSRGSKQAGL